MSTYGLSRRILFFCCFCSFPRHAPDVDAFVSNAESLFGLCHPSLLNILSTRRVFPIRHRILATCPLYSPCPMTPPCLASRCPLCGPDCSSVALLPTRAVVPREWRMVLARTDIPWTHIVNKANNMDETSLYWMAISVAMKCSTLCFGEVVDYYPSALKVGEIRKGRASVHVSSSWSHCSVLDFIEINWLSSWSWSIRDNREQ